MKSDLYTKFVLTVIAVALLWLCYRYSRQPTGQQHEPIRVSINDIEFEDQALPVRVILKKPSSSLDEALDDDNPMPVSIKR